MERSRAWDEQRAIVAPATLGEFCFVCGNDFNYWDISAVDGVNLSADIEPLPPFPATNPLSPGDVFWCQYPNSVPGADLRESCPAAFQLLRSQLSMTIAGSPDNVVACFSNCGRYEYPEAPPLDCTDAEDPRCSPWRQFWRLAPAATSRAPPPACCVVGMPRARQRVDGGAAGSVSAASLARERGHVMCAEAAQA